MSGFRVEGLKRFSEQRMNGREKDQSPNNTRGLPRGIIYLLRNDSLQFTNEIPEPQSPEKEQKRANRSFSGVQPIGELEEVLNKYEAPELVKKRIVRRAGGLIGHGLSQDTVEITILETMVPDGLPKWQKVEAEIADQAHTIYKKGVR